MYLSETRAIRKGIKKHYFYRMKIDEIYGFWKVVPIENLQDGCEIKCPKCEKWFSHKDWLESSVPCEDCGDHAAMQCPNCKEEFDHIGSEKFECRIPE